MLLHLLLDGDSTGLLPWVVDKDVLDNVSGPEDLLGENIQQQIVY